MKKFFAEFFGTFLLVFGGTGLSVLNEIFSLNISVFVFAIFWGALVVVLMFLFGRISGAQLNPMVTLVLILDGEMSPKEAPVYIVGQFSGSLLGSLALKMFAPQGTGYGATLPHSSLLIVSATEALLTFVLIVVVLLTVGQRFNVLAVAFFVTISVDILAGSGISGSSMNPARSFGPAVVSGSLCYYWLYLFMPLIGTLLAWLFVRWLRKENHISHK